MAEEAHVALEGVRMGFGDRQVFGQLTCGFPRGQISVILGGSGSGKSTILRLIGGLVRPQAGRVLVDGEDVTRLPERGLFRVREKVGMMFQNGALLDSLTVFDNLAFPLREHTRLSEAEIAEAVHEQLVGVGLRDVDRLLPGQLSGGMLKRVALARALMGKPVIVLCDEPFSGLDPVSVRLIEALLMRVNHRYHMTLIVVSHHIATTLRLADKVLVLLADGPVEGTPEALRGSANPRVAAFFDERAADMAAAERLAVENHA